MDVISYIYKDLRIAELELENKHLKEKLELLEEFYNERVEEHYNERVKEIKNED